MYKLIHVVTGLTARSAQDLVAHEQSRWVGRVAEALYNVEAAANRRAVDMPGIVKGKMGEWENGMRMGWECDYPLVNSHIYIWKITIFNNYNWAIFNSYVKLPEGRWWYSMGLFNVGDVIFQAGDNSTEAGDKSGCICYLDASSMGRKKGQSTDRVVSNRSLLRSNINQEKPCMTVSTGPSNQGHRMLVVAWLLVFGSRLPCFVFWLRSRGLSLQLLHCCFFGGCACTFCLASVRRVWCL